MNFTDLQLTAGGKKENRRKHDFYPTPPDVTIALMEFLKLDPIIIWEPACGNGAMVNVLESYGHKVIATDITSGDDYLHTKRTADAIITNPPFNLSSEFITKALGEANIVAMVFKSQFWHAKNRISLFEKHPPAFILPLTWRPDFLYQEREKGGKSASPTMEVIWTVWINGNTGFKYIPLHKPKATQKQELTKNLF